MGSRCVVRRRLVRDTAAVASILAAPSRAVPDERRPLRSSAPRKLLQLLLQGEREPRFDLKPDAEYRGGGQEFSTKVIEFW
jgi:hypothetical protein